MASRIAFRLGSTVAPREGDDCDVLKDVSAVEDLHECMNAYHEDFDRDDLKDRHCDGLPGFPQMKRRPSAHRTQALLRQSA